MGRHVNHLLDDYYDNELSAENRRHVKAHLADCPSCQAELDQLIQLGGLLSEFQLPDAFSTAETFRAQVVLRVSRRAREQSKYKGAIWYFVPLALLSVLAMLQTLFVLFALMGRAIRSVEWLGIDVGSLLAQGGIAWPVGGAILGLPLSLMLTALGAVLMIGLYLGVFVLWIPYAGWVGALWRSSRAGQASVER
jgi:predicted anti-sigma-YlaC factor YlaD